MEIIGLDLHKRESQLCRQCPNGPIRYERIPTSRAQFTATLGGISPARILLEASTESEWVAMHLEGLGHTVIVADPNFAPMYATLSRRIKTDRRDALALMEACTRGTYRAAYRLSPERRHLRTLLAVRDALVRTRTRWIAFCRTRVRAHGLRVPSGSSERFGARVAALDLPAVAPTLGAELAPLLTLLPALSAELVARDAELAALAAAPLRRWGLAVAGRRGKRVAAVALARRLAGVLYAMWRDETEYAAARVPRGGRRA